MNKNVLLIEKDKRLKEFWEDILQDEGFSVDSARTEGDLSNLKNNVPDLVFLGTGLEKANIRNMLEEMKKKNERLLVISPTNPDELIKELDVIEAQGLNYKEHPIRIDQVKTGIRDAIRI